MSFLPPKPAVTAEVNLMPVVDCLTVLMCYVLISATFPGLSFLGTQVVRPSTLANAPVPYEYAIVSLSDDGRMVFSASNDRDELPRVPRRKTGYDFDGFSRVVEKLPAKFLEIVILPTKQTSYETLVKLTEIARKQGRPVVLSGVPQP